MARPFAALRGAITATGMRYGEFAETIGMSGSALSDRLCCRVEWTLEEMYTVIEALGERASAIPRLFPRRGINDPQVWRPARVSRLTAVKHETRALTRG